MPILYHCINDELSGGIRLDRYTAEYLQVLSRSQLKVRKLEALVNGKKVKLSFLVKYGDRLELSWNDPEPVDLLPENIMLDIIYEDDQVLVINKMQGMVVHPGAGNRRGTLANAVFYRQLQKGIKPQQSLRPGIVHRLDKDTSGVIITAYNEETHVFLSDQFKSHAAKKKYIALVNGKIKNDTGSIETHIARDPRNRKLFAVSEHGKTALTKYRVIKRWNDYSLVLLRPCTGRTHQLRLHMKYIGHAIAGDPLYGSVDPLFPRISLMLHSQSLDILLPHYKDRQVYTAPLPDRIKQMIRVLNLKETAGNNVSH